MADPVSSTVVFSHAVPVAEPLPEAAAEPEGGDQPSATPVTAEPAGTDSSESSNQDEKSGESSENETPSPAPTAENPSDPAARTESFSADSTDGAGTAL